MIDLADRAGFATIMREEGIKSELVIGVLWRTFSQSQDQTIFEARYLARSADEVSILKSIMSERD